MTLDTKIGKSISRRYRLNYEEETRGEEEEGEELDVDEQLNKIEQAIKEAAEETIQEQKLTSEENWFDEECAEIIEEKIYSKTKNTGKRNKGKNGKIPRAEKESE